MTPAPIMPRRSSLLGVTPIAPEDGAPLVSVVIATYNRAPLVTRAIESALNQTLRDLEVIVVDDASPDGTAEAVHKIDDPRLRFTRLAKNRGQPGAQNAGIAQARGEWVAFLDDDDEWLPEKLERQLQRVRELGDPLVGVVYCNCMVRTDEGVRARQGTALLEEGDVLDAMLYGSPVMATAMYVVKRDALFQAGGFDETMPGVHDGDLWRRLAQQGHHFAAVQEALVIYSIGAGYRQSTDPLVAARGARALHRRWGPLISERIGRETYEKRLGWQLRKVNRMHRRHVKTLMRSGGRGEAWRYVRRMTPVLPWCARHVALALAVAALGRLPYRVYRLRKRVRGHSGAKEPALPEERD